MNAGVRFFVRLMRACLGRLAEGDQMNTLNHNLESAHGASRIDKWVLESCFLDLLVDEEEPEDLKGWAQALGWSPILAKAQKKIKKARRNDEDNTYWVFRDSVLNSELMKSDLKHSWRIAELFLNMKAARARASLDCNRTRYDYAQSPNKDGKQSVRKAIKAVSNTLDAIIMDSFAAFGLIQRNPERVDQRWSVLAALFHSEVCASGTTPDVSYGMARAFDKFFRFSEMKWGWLFRLISINNQGRGLSHQPNYEECIRLLVPFVEDFETNKNFVPPDLKEKDRRLAQRLIFFRAVFTLAGSLKDCHRKPEAAWWLRYALRKEPSDYWRSCIEVALSSLVFPEGQCLTLNKPNMPKLMNENQQSVYLWNERLIVNDNNNMQVHDLTSKWAEALTWTIRWHEEDPVYLKGTIQGAAQSIKTVAEALKNRSKQNYNSMICLMNIKEVLETLQKVIQSYPQDRVFQFLSPHKSADLHLKLGEAIHTWKALEWLMPALQAAMKFRRQLINEAGSNVPVKEPFPNLWRWLKTLEQRLRKASKQKRFEFEYVAYVQHVFKLLQNPEKLCSNRRPKRVKGCRNNPNCAEEVLQLGNSSRNSCVASTKYLLTRMSRFEAEFTRFLKIPSLVRYDPTKKQKHPVTPLMEFISLKRWSSFSPNLASHGTTTVGGGYLVRVWDKNSEGYIGIAIDPGYNYLENLFDEGFTLPDVHVIVITHAHPDHVENLSNILTLLREREKRINTISRVFLVLTQGVFQRFKTLIDNEIEYIHDVVVLSWDRPKRDTVCVVRGVGQGGNGGPISLIVGDESKLGNKSTRHHELNPSLTVLVAIQAVQAIHTDGTEFDSMGVVIRVPSQKKRGLQIGFTGDTRYSSSLCNQDGFAHCNVVVPHLGSVIKSKAFSNSHESCSLDLKENLKRALKQLQPTLTEENHLYIPGISMFLCDIKKAVKGTQPKSKPPLIILSEFGEELRGGLRADLATRLQRIFKMEVLPADVGLRVGVKDRSVRCAICRQYVHAAAVRPVTVSDEDEALLFVCKDCYRARQHELPALLERLRKTPHELYIDSKGEPGGSKKGSEDGKD